MFPIDLNEGRIISGGSSTGAGTGVGAGVGAGCSCFACGVGVFVVGAVIFSFNFASWYLS